MALLEIAIEKLRKREFTDEQLALLDQTMKRMLRKLKERERAKEPNA